MASEVVVAMVAGEASGDLLASHLMKALAVRRPEIRFVGIGGSRMQSLGFDAWWPAEKLSVRGYFEVLKHYREIAQIRRQLLARLSKERPAVFIGVDAPDFNLWLEKRLKRQGIPAIHYVSPSIWAWRGGRMRGIRKSVSHMLCLFPFESALYQHAGVPVTYIGHPLADVIPVEDQRHAARERLALGPEQKVFALLPGSRQSELQYMAGTWIETARELLKRFPDAVFLVPLATRETRAMFEQAMWDAQASDLPLRILFGHAQDALMACDAALVASGTATLEAALCKAPHVIAYRMNRWSWLLMKRMAYLPWVGLPNILCNESVVPELLQDEASPQRLAEAMAGLCDDVQRSQDIRARFTRLHLELKQDSAQRAADAISDYLPKP